MGVEGRIPKEEVRGELEEREMTPRAILDVGSTGLVTWAERGKRER